MFPSLTTNPTRNTQPVPGTANANPGTTPNPITPEPTTGSDLNSLDQVTRSLTNFLGTTAPGTLAAGTDILGAGGGTVQGALQGMQGPLAYWNALLTGDPKATSAAIAPTADAISKQYAAAERGIDTGAARGGLRSGQLAELPFAQASQIGTALEQLQPQAAQNILGTLQTIAGIGQSQQGIGLGEQGISLQQFGQALTALLQRRGQNAGQDTANIGSLASGLAALI